MKDRPKILITGALGFLGRNLISTLGQYEVKGIARDSTIFNEVEIFSSQQLDQITYEPDIVIACHAAVSSGQTEMDNKSLYEANVYFSEQITKKFPRSFFIYISTASVYWNQGIKIKEDALVSPQNNYALSKLWGERIFLAQDRSCILRLSSIYGLGMKENTIIPYWVQQALLHKKIQVWGDGSRKQNYIHVQDVGDLIERMIQNREKLIGKIMLGVHDQEYTNLQLAQIISDHIYSEMICKGQDESKTWQYDASWTYDQLGKKSFKRFEEGIKAYIQWRKQL